MPADPSAPTADERETVSSRNLDQGFRGRGQRESPGQTPCATESPNSRLVKSAMRTPTPDQMCDLVIDDGGRARAGFRGDAGDCVTRAIAIATGSDYRWVYDELAAGMERLGKPKSARNGISPKVYKPFIETEFEWPWTPTMSIGSGTTVHLRRDELPDGRLIVRLSGHVCAVLDGHVYDTHDPRRDGTRCVYGYWKDPYT